MVDPKVDELSMMTYLSQYPNAKIAPEAPLKTPKTNVARVKCYGKGVEPTGNLVDAPTKFFVETSNAGQGNVDVVIINPKGGKEPVFFSFFFFFFYFEKLTILKNI
jgi:filamin